MLQVRLFLCSESASIDARNNSLSAFHILEQINSPHFPSVIPRLCVILLMTREAEDPSRSGLQLRIELAGGQQLFSGPIDVNFVQQLSARIIIDIQAFLVPAPGNLRFSVRDGQAELCFWSITVMQIAGQPLQMRFVSPPSPAGAGNQ